MSTSPPFKIRVLDLRPEPRVESEAVDFASLLPASHRTKRDHIEVPSFKTDFLERELLVDRLDDVQDWLWICGRPMPPRPLHHQVLISRDIAITEDPGLHLVWAKNRIFLKPIPLYLFDPDFWTAHIIPNPKLAACARGFLFTYAALIAYESDYMLAVEKRLLPKAITWAQWKEFAKEIIDNHSYAAVNPRYWYGELRLSRLNKVYRVFKGFVLRGYSKVASHAVYADLVRDNFAALATILGYVVIVLTAMQVGLSVDRLESDEAFQNASYGFTVFSIIAPLVASMGIALLVVVMFVSNWVVTKSYERERFGVMGVEPAWRRQKAGATASSVKGNQTTPTDQNV